MSDIRHDVSLLTDHDVYLFKEGRHHKLYRKLGSHPMEVDGQSGALFAVWAPNAESVAVFGDFNDWDTKRHQLRLRQDESGIWEGFVPGAMHSHRYKYRIRSRQGGDEFDKGDPYGFRWELPPETATVVWDLSRTWEDADWMANRHQRNALDAPHSCYEMHLGSWRHTPDDEHPEGRAMSYLELADTLPRYLLDMGFTHVEFLPVMEHPFYGSWGYQCLGFFAPTCRYGTPQEFMRLVEALHQAGIGVILDWVPSHYPSDAHGLATFDGTHLYEHEDPRQGYHPDWKSDIFNYGRNEVRSFLISSAHFWLDVCHADGLRVDAVASMLYLDYSREDGEWIPNKYGGRENIEAIEFLRILNESAYGDFEGVQTIAEESTAWPQVSRPAYLGGLGFGMKWNMGWMHDTLDYFRKDPVYRRYHQSQWTFSIWYAFNENFVLALSHDEVVHGKGSLIGKMPGDAWRQFANLRLLYGYMWAHPGKKLLFMGGEFAQGKEWNHDAELDWNLLDIHWHDGMRLWVRDLNLLYRAEPALHRLDFDLEGFEWVDFHDSDNSVLVFLRRDGQGRTVLVACNATPEPHASYRIGVPAPGFWEEVLNSDSPTYGGSGWGNTGGLESVPVPSHGHYDSVSMTLPPLGAVFLRHTGEG
ncbi:1,4-alpha-glucan branching protein GlgB [Desulfohalovibrio reitneri]|uniref:1,4-alpha-glucan branching protein GlgB n=1 Tax=Desulfohalovibrio reitneri TaxID=1307759 RepID=UPI0004A6B53A|nr:1,4-alpha-glucan branching protein GlgB [Desulfohalovibrio reitneri]